MPGMLFKFEPNIAWSCETCHAEGNTDKVGEVAHFCEHPLVIRTPTTNLMPSSQGKRDAIRPRYDLIPQQWMEAIARIFEEGRKPRPGLLEGYGDSWKQGGKEFLQDCLNHAQHHLLLYHQGDRSEEHLAKVAWNVLAVNYHSKLKGEGDGSR